MTARWLPVVALGFVVAVAAGGVLLATVRSAPATDAQRAEALARELRCPDCQSLSVADSPTQSAREIRRQIDELIADGATDDEVRAHFVARYGEWIKLAPSNPMPWLAPFAVLLGGVVALVVWLRRAGSAGEPPGAPVTPAARRAVREEAEALDA